MFRALSAEFHIPAFIYAKKTMVAFAGLLLLAGCISDKELQIEMISVQLVKVDTISRGDRYEKMLTWQTNDRTRFYSFEDLEADYPVGTSMRVMVRK